MEESISRFYTMPSGNEETEPGNQSLGNKAGLGGEEEQQLSVLYSSLS